MSAPSPAVAGDSDLKDSISVEEPLVRIRPPRRWEAVDLRVIWHYRDLLVAFAVRDIKLRYRQTLLGVIWVLIQPLMAAGIFSFVFGRIAKLDSGNIPYFPFAYTGLLAWNLFSSTVLKSAGSLVGNASLVSKVFFPRLLLPFSGAVSTLVDFAIAAAAGCVLLLAYQVTPGFSIVLAPFWLLFLVLFALGIGMFCAALAVRFRDVNHILPVLLQLMLYGSPVAYTLAIIPPGLPMLLYKLNPMATLLHGFRVAIFGEGYVGFPSTIYAITASLLMFVIGMIFFRRMERQFADVI